MRLILILLVLIGQSAALAFESCSYLYQSSESQTHGLWYQYITKKLFLETRYNQKPETFELFFGKYFGIDAAHELGINPAVGIVWGKTQGVTVENYLMGKLFGVSFFNQCQATFSGPGGHHWLFEWLGVDCYEIKKTGKKSPGITLEIIEEAYHEFTSGFIRELRAGPGATIRYGSWFGKPSYLLSASDHNPDKLMVIIGCRF